MKNFLKSAASVRPSENQANWFDTEFYGFVHFSPNTYTGLEWGLGNEDPAIFNPVKLDCDQWAAAMKSAGMKGMILTAKHHDGFCLWQTKYTDHSIKSSPFMGGKGDIVKAASDACRRAGLKFGFYLSPWDRNSPLYGTDAYNDYYKAQLTELLTNYGDIFMVWFDGACGEGPNGKKQVYDFPGYIELVKKYQPNAAVFGEWGDVRWIGNEAGSTRYAEWAVIPKEQDGGLCPVQTPPSPFAAKGVTRSAMDPGVGALPDILTSEGLIFKPAEVDMSIRPGWFYHPTEEPHSLQRLFDTYIRTVGGNACFHLNTPPTPDGLFDERDVKRLKELGDAIREAFSKPIEIKTETLLSEEHRAKLRLTWNGPQKIKYVVLAEDLFEGQRIETFALCNVNGGAVFHGTTVGHKRICPVAFEGDVLIIDVTFSRGDVKLRSIEVFA